MLHSQLEELCNVLVIEGVEGELAVAAVTDETHLPQLPQVMRYSGGAGADRRCQVTDAELAMGEGTDDLQAGGVRQDLKSIGGEGELILAAEGIARGVDGAGIDEMVVVRQAVSHV